jgi:hypothetical protein
MVSRPLGRRASLNPPNLAVKQTLVNRIGRSMPSVPLLVPVAGCPPLDHGLGRQVLSQGRRTGPSPRQDRHEVRQRRVVDLAEAGRIERVVRERPGGRGGGQLGWRDRPTLTSRWIGGRIHCHTNGPPNPDRFLSTLDRALPLGNVAGRP